MISVVTWLWEEGFRDYQAAHVNTLATMIRRQLAIPHRFVCVADRADGFDPKVVDWVPTPPAAIEVGRLRNPEGKRFPSCYRRLWMFSQEAAALGDRLLLIDIDLVAVSELAHLFTFKAPFVGWRPLATWGSHQRYGGGIYLLTPGARAHVWEQFNGENSILEARAAGFRGSDQAWLSYKLGADEAVWPQSVGIYSIRDMKNGALPVPADACLVQFNGPQKPWNSPLPWVRDHWR